MPFFYYKPVMCFQYEIKNYEITEQLLSKFLQSLSIFTKLWIENGTFLNVKCMRFFLCICHYLCLETVTALRMSNFIICEWQASLLHSIQNNCLFIIIMIWVFNLKFFLVSDSVYYYNSVQEAAFMFTWPPQLYMYWNLVHEWQ